MTATTRDGDRAPARHLLHVFPSFEPGGVQNRMADVINHLGRRYRHSIIALDGRRRAAGRVCIDLVDYPDLAMAGIGRIGGIRRCLRAIAPDGLATYNWGAIDWAMANRMRPVCPHIHFESGFGIEEAARQLRRRVKLRRFALARTQAVVVPSQTLVDLADRAWHLPASRLVHIPNGVDRERFADPAVQPCFSRSDAEIVIGTLAPLRPEKRLELLIDGFAALDNRSCRLVIAGDGDQRPDLERYASSRGVADRVAFLGHVVRPEAVLAGLDLYALSSATEQMPNAVLQAMAAGLPVAAVAVGDVPHMMAEANRDFVVAPEDFGSALATLVADAGLRSRLGAANRTRAADFDIGLMLAAYDRLFDRVFGGG